jgi:hypothetical protein
MLGLALFESSAATLSVEPDSAARWRPGGVNEIHSTKPIAVATTAESIKAGHLTGAIHIHSQ